MKESVTTNANDQSRTRRLVIGSVVMLLIAAGIFGSLFQRQTRLSRAAQPQARQAPDITPEVKEQIVGRAKELREKWRPWALQNKAILTRMRSAASTDKAAMLAVWKAIPMGQEPISAQDLTPGGVEPPSNIGFTWAAADKMIIDNSRLRPEVRKVVEQGSSAGALWREDDFASERDIVISQSMNGGQTHINLWASGRITEQTRQPPSERPKLLARLRAEKRKARESDLHGPHREVVPPYDFLPQTVSPKE